MTHKHSFIFGTHYVSERRLLHFAFENYDPKPDPFASDVNLESREQQFQNQLAARNKEVDEMKRQLEENNKQIESLRDALTKATASIERIESMQKAGLMPKPVDPKIPESVLDNTHTPVRVPGVRTYGQEVLSGPKARTYLQQYPERYAGINNVSSQPSIRMLDAPPSNPESFKIFVEQLYRKKANIFSRMSNCMQEYSRPYSRGGGSLMQKRQALAAAKSIRLCEYNPILEQIANARSVFESTPDLQSELGAKDWVTLISEEGWIADRYSNMRMDTDRRKAGVQQIYDRIAQNNPEAYARMMTVREGSQTAPVTNSITGQEYTNRELGQLRTHRLFNSTRGGSSVFAANLFAQRAVREKYGIEPYAIPTTISSIIYRPVVLTIEKGESIPYRSYSPARARLTRLVDGMEFNQNSGLSNLPEKQFKALQKLFLQLGEKQKKSFIKFSQSWKLFDRNNIHDYLRVAHDPDGTLRLWVRNQNNEAWNYFTLQSNGQMKSLGTTEKEEGNTQGKVEKAGTTQSVPVMPIPTFARSPMPKKGGPVFVDRDGIPVVPDIDTPMEEIIPDNSAEVDSDSGVVDDLFNDDEPEINTKNTVKSAPELNNITDKLNQLRLMSDVLEKVESKDNKIIFTLRDGYNLNKMDLTKNLTSELNGVQEVKKDGQRLIFTIDETFWNNDKFKITYDLLNAYFVL